MERRTKRSEERDLALQYLLEAVHDRSDVVAMALVEPNGRIVAGVGSPKRLVDLAAAARPAVEGRVADLEGSLADADVLACRVGAGHDLVLAALGTRVRRMRDAAVAAARICNLVPA